MCAALAAYQAARTERAGELVLRARKRCDVTHAKDPQVTAQWYDELRKEDGTNIIRGIVGNIFGVRSRRHRDPATSYVDVIDGVLPHAQQQREQQAVGVLGIDARQQLGQQCLAVRGDDHEIGLLARIQIADPVLDVQRPRTGQRRGEQKVGGRDRERLSPGSLMCTLKQSLSTRGSATRPPRTHRCPVPR